MTTGPKPRPWQDRLLEKIAIRGPDDCWEWTASKHRGYGKLGIKRGEAPHLAHRLAYRHFVGPIPEGQFVLHKCDNPGCCNPQHLFLGSQPDNIADMVGKERQRGGSLAGTKNPRAKLTEPQIIAIRADHRVQREIAAEYGVHKSIISEIKRRLIWSHI